MIWQFIASELKFSLDEYEKNSKDNNEGLRQLNTKIQNQESLKKQKIAEMAKVEESITSIIPTLNAINAILKRFNFESFQLAENTHTRGTYKIIRISGEDAKETLSEGEYNFITFLYFYHLVYGSHDKSGINLPKIVVIDDPVSSLDSNVLFIVNTLTSQIVQDCLNNNLDIVQVFILTHNIYFHKEVVFLGPRYNPPKNTIAYWVFKKYNNISMIETYNANPIKTSYELLWK